MIRYEWYMLPGESYSVPTNSVPANYAIPFLTVLPTSPTQATIIAGNPITSPGSYAGAISTLPNFNGFSDPDFHPLNDLDGIIFEAGLTPGTKYYLRLRAYSGSNATGTYGDYSYQEFTMPKASSAGGVVSTLSGTTTPKTVEPFNPNISNSLETVTPNQEKSPLVITGSSYAVNANRQVSRSLYKISNNSKDSKKYSISTKSTPIPTSYNHYTFGSGMFFQASTRDVPAAGGIGFFVDNLGLNGYYVLIKTTSGLSNTSDKEISILKMVNGNVIALTDSQKTPSKTLTGVLGGVMYKIDIKVECKVVSGLNYRVIDVYINNFKISAVDIDTASTTNTSKLVLPKTDKVAMFASSGEAYFDYIYGTPLTETEYKNGIVQNMYNGQFGETTLKFLYGEKFIDGLTKSNSQAGYFEEFGTVARELRKINIKYDSRPGYPIYPSIGINKFVSVLGSRLTSFGAEVYVINNAGTYVPLDDSGLHSFSVIGNYLVTSGQHEYVSGTINEGTNPEPVTFESLWIQSEADAKSLSDWIKNQWSKQQQVINMDIFGNPLISVGDVIAINYPKNNLDGTQKFIVTNVNTEFSGGLETSITARSIYS